MARKKERIMVTWTDDSQKSAEAIVEKYGSEMSKSGIAPHVPSPEGGLVINRSGAIQFALKKLLELEPQK
jgi:hypothetical protein